MKRRVATSGYLVWDAVNKKTTFVELTGYDYDGPVEQCKGSASKTEQTAADTQRAQENQLMTGQLALQGKQLADVNASIDPIINSIIQGQTPPVLAPMESALTASYMNLLPQAYRQGIGQINQNLVARGLTGGTGGAGGGAIGSDYGAMIAALGGAQQQGATNTALTMNNAKLNLLQNDLGLKLGIGNQYGSNVSGFNQGALGALNAGVTAANNVDQAQTSFLGPMMGGLFSLGSAGLTGGLSAAFPKGCWIAAACYPGGFDSPVVKFIRIRLFHNAQRSLKFKVILAAYLLFGKAIAKVVKKSQWLRDKFTTMFDSFVASEKDVILNEAVNG